MSNETELASLDGTPDAVIAGTLCLMSCYVQNPVPIYAERVAGNLETMARLADLSPELRTICRRLADRWEGILNDSRHRAERGAKVIDHRAVH